MISYKIYGHPSRIDMIHRLQSDLGIADADVYLDDRNKRGRCIYTAKKAWLAPFVEGETYRVALPDDAYPCNGFKDIIERMVKAHPDDIISLFPHDYQNILPIGFEMERTPYIEVCIMTCCGIVMPVKYIKPCFDWIWEIYHDDIEDDKAIQAWAKAHGVRCITTIPSTVQHIGDESIVTPGVRIRRTKYFSKDVDPTVDWDCTRVAKGRVQENFYADHCYKKNGVYYVKTSAMEQNYT